MGETGIPEAEQIGRVWSAGGAMDTPALPPRCIWHTTESGAGDAAFKNVGQYLLAQDVYPHVLYDPTTDRLGQYLPLSMSARALKNDGSTRTNRTGAVCIQIEVLARAATPFTGYWEPGPNFRALMRAIRSWHIPDAFPMGTPAATASQCRRVRSIWLNEAGHYGHCNVPGNTHWDPGGISPAKLFTAAAGTGTPTTPKPEEDPMAGITRQDIFDAVWKTDQVTAPPGTDVKNNPTWAAQSFLKDIDARLRALQTTEAAQSATIAQLAKTVAALAANSADIDADALVAKIKAAIDAVTVHLDTTEAS